MVAVGAVPPPINGAAVITAAVCDALGDSVKLVLVNTSATHRSSLEYHFHRAGCHVAAVVALVRNARRTRRTLYASCPGGLALWYLTGILMVARVLRYRMVIHHHSFAYLTKGSTAMRLVVRLAGRNSTQVVLCARMEAELADVYRPQGTVLTCSNAAWFKDVGHEPRDDPDASRPFTLGHLGSLTVEKGLADVLQTLRGLLEAGIDARLLLAGPLKGDIERRLVEAASDLTGHVDLLGPLEGSTKRAFFHSIDAFVFPTRYVHEAEPLVVLEALAAGVQVVAYGRGCISTLIEGRAGLVLHPDSDFAPEAVSYLTEVARCPDQSPIARLAATQQFGRHASGAMSGRSSLLYILRGRDES